MLGNFGRGSIFSRSGFKKLWVLLFSKNLKEISVSPPNSPKCCEKQVGGSIIFKKLYNGIERGHVGIQSRAFFVCPDRRDFQIFLAL